MSYDDVNRTTNNSYFGLRVRIQPSACVLSSLTTNANSQVRIRGQAMPSRRSLSCRPRQASSTYKWVYFEALVTAGHAMEQDEVIRSADARRTRASVDKAFLSEYLTWAMVLLAYLYNVLSASVTTLQPRRCSTRAGHARLFESQSTFRGHLKTRRMV